MLVSVVVPVCNAEKFIVECLESILKQDYQPIEIVVVDNNSTDGTTEILQRYADRGVRIVKEPRPSAAIARNTGVKAALGDLIAFQDADDVWLPNKLGPQIKYLQEHSDIDIVFGQFANWYPDQHGKYRAAEDFLQTPELWEVKEPLTGWIYADTLVFCPIAMITPVIRRKVFTTVGGFDESLEAGSDYDFWLKATYKFKAHKLSGCMALYRQHGAGITSKVRARSTLALVLERAISTTGLVGPDGRKVSEQQMRLRFAELWFHFGVLHMQRGSLAIGWTSLRKHVQLSTAKGRAWMEIIRMLPSMLRQRLFGALRKLGFVR